MIAESDWVSAKGQELIRKGRQEFIRSRYLEISLDEHEAAEDLARTALKTLRSAMNWTEDTDEFEPAHQLLDKVGRYSRTNFGCHLLYEDGKYFQTCPVALAHNRIGFSIGYIARSVECSICSEDPEYCPHITGRLYDGIRCVRTIMDGDILEVSIVNRPRQPDTRIERIELRTDTLRRSLPTSWKPGMPVNCDRCLTPCGGVIEHEYETHGIPSGDISTLKASSGLKFEATIAIEGSSDSSNP